MSHQDPDAVVPPDEDAVVPPGRSAREGAPENAAEDPPGASADPALTDAADEWHRVHPISPLVRGWIALVAIVYFFGQSWAENLFSDLTGIGGDEPEESGTWNPAELAATQEGLLWVVGISLGVLLLILLGFFLSWRFTKYQVTEGHVNVRSGILFRQQRQARIDRVQAIDIGQPLVARITGLGELKFEVADGGSTAMKLSYLKLAEAKRLRHRILARAGGLRAAQSGTARPAESPSGTGAGGAPPAGADDVAPAGTLPDPGTSVAGTTGAAPVLTDADLEAPENVLVRVPPGRLVLSLLVSPWLWFVFAALAGGIVGEVLTEGAFRTVYLVPGLFGILPWLWTEFSNGFNFRAGVSPDGLRMSYGLLDTHHQTVPPGRVQAVQVTQGVIWKLFGWHKVTVNVAGYGEATGGSAARSTVLPVGTRQDVLNVLAIILPNPGTDRPLELIDAGIAGRGTGEGFTTSPRTARLLSPFAWSRQGYTVTRTAVFARSGFLVRSLFMVPHERTQGIRLTQGPLERWRGVADVSLVTTDGPVHPAITQAGAAEARRFFLEQAERAAEARHLHDHDHWLDDDPYGAPQRGPVAEGER
ncbi:PH domain-containing protein [Zhihengliuella sp.]|uniref:PH domain-containing protein n=1 Tax=Zhihengliuella sp. TaxID=1954483 RepID=UPI0028126217|nr:PH domain-containing protein [Zhihengliuella sp.]